MKKLVILGAGESGVGTAILGRKQGYDVFVSDSSDIKDKYRKELASKNIPWEERGHTERVLDADEVVKSPGIPKDAPVIKLLKTKNIPVVSEIDFAGRYTDAKMICITGSNGKTTTTLLTYHILKSGGLNVGLGGNVGSSFARQVAECNYDYYVLEISSFQLDDTYSFRADVAIILNITPDHLDRYDNNMQNYIDAKFRIIRNQKPEDAFVYWNDDPVIKKEVQKRNIVARKFPFSLNRGNGIKAFLENEVLMIDTPEQQFKILREELALIGTHNLYNTLAAAISANIAHIKKENIKKALCDFKGVEHRLEYVATVKGVRYVNDSKATNVNSCWYALESMKTSVVLILGGKDKGNDYNEIKDLVKNKVRKLIFLGVNNDKLHSFFDPFGIPSFDARSMKDAVDCCYKQSVEGDTVLLSPCCASFDLFNSYKDRGDQFKECVRKL